MARAIRVSSATKGEWRLGTDREDEEGSIEYEEGLPWCGWAQWTVDGDGLSHKCNTSSWSVAVDVKAWAEGTEGHLEIAESRIWLCATGGSAEITTVVTSASWNWTGFKLKSANPIMRLFSGTGNGSVRVRHAWVLVPRVVCTALCTSLHKPEPHFPTKAGVAVFPGPPRPSAHHASNFHTTFNKVLQLRRLHANNEASFLQRVRFKK